MTQGLLDTGQHMWVTLICCGKYGSWMNKLTTEEVNNTLLLTRDN